MKCQCLRYISEQVYVKVAEDRNAASGYRLISESGRWADAIGSALNITEVMPEIYSPTDCDQCKHKLACIVMPQVVRMFEGK